MKSYLIIFHLILLLFGFFFVEHHLDTPGRTAADREMLMSDGSGIAARIAAVGQINTAQAQSSTTTTQVAVTEAAVDGQKVYQSACIACHGPAGKGNGPAKIPSLSGQHADYLYSQLKNFQSETRSNDPNKMMRNIVHRMTNEELKAVSDYIQGLY